MAEELKACRYRVEKTGYGFWPYCVRAGDGTRELFKGHQKQCMVVAAELETAFEDGKFVADRAQLPSQGGEAVAVVTTWHPDSRSYEEQIVKYDTKGSRKSLGAMNAKLRAKVGRLERELSTVKQSLTVPLEPTEEMLDVAVSFALNVSLSGEYNWSAYMRDVWQRMVKAAPAEPVSREAVEVVAWRIKGDTSSPALMSNGAALFNERNYPGSLADREPLMTVAQHQRILAAATHPADQGAELGAAFDSVRELIREELSHAYHERKTTDEALDAIRALLAKP